ISKRRKSVPEFIIRIHPRMNDLFKRRLTLIIGLLLLVGGGATCKRLAGSRSSPERTNGPAASRPVCGCWKLAMAPCAPASRHRAECAPRTACSSQRKWAAHCSAPAKPFREGTSFSKGDSRFFRIDEGEGAQCINHQQSAFIRIWCSWCPICGSTGPRKQPSGRLYLKKVPIEGVLPALLVLSSRIGNGTTSPGAGCWNIGHYSLRALYERRRSAGCGDRTIRWRGNDSGSSPGPIITPGTRLGELIAPNTLELESAVGAGELRHVRVGDTLRFQAEDGSEAKGRIIRQGRPLMRPRRP
ncbi:MAG: HlyD family secretion protein, partial [Flavobacteriales bacterium]|nr:HlyD family secretion protein [Flavobacteriales bacterium]